MNKSLFKIGFGTEGFPGENKEYVLGRVTGMLDALLLDLDSIPYTMMSNTNETCYIMAYNTDLETLESALKRISKFYPNIGFKVF